ILKKIDVVLAVGDREDETLTDFCQTLDLPPPSLDKQSLGWGEALVWFRHQYEAPQKLSIAADDLERHRHRRKYADGDVGRDRSFYFTGPHRQLNIRTQNLLFFVQVADGVDDETWLYHLRKGDYSKWFKTVINDQVLADQMALIEQNQALSAAESRLRTRQIVSDRYTQSIKVY
ncbi:MAG TPA: hypothetical protein V6C72_01335, partial [Chroococcales cyanobacterium]